MAKRFVVNGVCVKCSMVHGKNYIKRHPEKCKKIALIESKKHRIKYPERRAAFSAQRRAKKLQAVPLWYEAELVKQLYCKRDELSKLWGIQLHVDHVVPLQGKAVCGLHCWDNLQLIEASLNLTKLNKF